MKISMASMSMCKQTKPLLQIPSGGFDMPFLRLQPPKEKVVVVMGATGTGKSRLSIDLATRFPAEIVNSDKIQVYQGLDIVTNKITQEETCGIPHHLLGIVDPDTDFTATNFCHMATHAVKSIVSKEQLPIIVGGSNSFIEALVDHEKFRSKYECCFLWVDVSMPVLQSFVSKRVDVMVERGMVDEIRNMYNPKADYTRGIRRAIGLPEFHRFIQTESESDVDQETRERLLHEAINMTKVNTGKLARRQWEKICRLRNLKGWKVHRLDATQVFKKHGEEADKAWRNLVAGPSTAVVSRFLYDYPYLDYGHFMGIKAPPLKVAAATH